MLRSFASDNHAGVHPEILKAIQEANVGYAPAYGADEWTKKAEMLAQKTFGDQAKFYPVFNGTGANVLALTSILKTYEAVICAAKAHIAEDECGAPEHYGGFKQIPILSDDCKLSPQMILEQAAEPLAWKGDIHRVQVKVISITQSTEFGAVYSIDEIKALSKFAHDRQMYLHMDGARAANAAAALGVSLKQMTTDCGVDILSLGGTKNGALAAEAVVVINPNLAPDFLFYRKQAMQLGSKMRFISAQWIALLSNDLWLKNAKHANAMAAKLTSEVSKIKGVTLAQKTQANAVFAKIPLRIVPELQKEFSFYIWEESKSTVRWMTSFQTTEKDIADFTKALQLALTRSPTGFDY